VLELYQTIPDAVVCFDELGPVRPIPTAGSGWAPEGRANVELVPTPTYASWLNRIIECQFGVMVKLLIAGSDYADHAELQAQASAWLRRRNHEARRDFEQRALERARRRERRAARKQERQAALVPQAA
jgi:hypothetical protein